jgi:hypothetical protein
MNASNAQNGAAPVEISTVREARKATKTTAKKKEPTKPVKPRLKWTLDTERDANGRAQQHAVGIDGSHYQMTGDGKEWKAVVTKPNKEKVTLVEKVSYIKAYQACVANHKANAS